MKQLILLFISLIGFSIYAQEEYPKGENLINYDKIKHISTNKEFGKVSIIEPYKKSNPLFEIETHTQPQFIYKCATSIPIHNRPVNLGRVFLLSFSAKTTKSSLETGEAKINLLFKQSNSYKNNLVSTQSISSKWQTYYVPFKSNINIQKKDLGIVLHYGFRPQTFKIKDIKFQIFSEGTKLESLPKTKIVYTGMEPNAQWRVEANKRIEAIRKGNFTLNIFKNGKPLENKKVQITLKEHAFPFGAMMHARDIINDKTQYNNFKKLFNLTVLGNDLKIKAWSYKKKRPITLKALEKLQKDKITTKGHVLMWPGFQYNTKEIRANKNNPEKIKEIVRTHLNSILTTTNGKVSHWDVVNETYTNKDFQNVMGGEDFLYEAFNITRNLAPKAKRFTNEYGIISSGGLDSKKQQWYYDYIKRVDKNTNNAIQGVGIQSHIGSDLTSPEKVLKILGYYATLGKQISISEFTMDIQESKIREQYTRDFMTVVFSHPNVSEFMFWGFKKDKNAKVDIYDENNEIGAMGKAYISLVFKDWKTNLTKSTNNLGKISSRGFYGLYEYTFINEGKVVNGTFHLKPRNSNIININLK